MNLLEAQQILKDAHEKSGLNYSMSYHTNTTPGDTFFVSESVGNVMSSRNTNVSTIDELVNFVSHANPKQARADALIRQRNELQKEIDELGGETLICNGDHHA